MMKKNFPKILAGCTAMVLMTGALLVPSMAVNASAHQAVPHLQQASYIGEAKAKEIALNHAGVDASKVSWIFAKQDYDHGRMEYDVEFLFGNKEYDYKIDASTGTILGFDYDIEWHMAGSDTVSQSSTDIGAEKAKSIALKHAGLAASDTAFIYANLDYENGLRVYDVEFFSGNKEYDYKINAATGDIVSFDQDIEWYAAGGYQAQANTGQTEYDYEIHAVTGAILSSDRDLENFEIPTVSVSSDDMISAEKAKSIALEHAGVAAADTVFINVELDYDDGMRVYDVEFFSGNKEYDYKIDAASGAILGFDFDVEWYTVSSKASDYIGEAKAKQIVEQAAGTTGVYTEFKLEVDDGRVLYEGEMRSGWMEYEFEIDAVTGAILDWDADWD